MKRTYLLAGVSILLWSTLPTVSKLLLGTMNNYQVLCVSALFAALALLVVNIFTGRLAVMRTYRCKDYLIMLLIGLPGNFLYYVLYYAGTDKLQASQAFIINYLWPIMSVVFACILLKEKMTARKGIAIAISFLGIITVAGGELISFQPETLIGVLLCVGAAVSYGAFTALNQKWNYDKQVAMMLSFFSAFLLSLIINFVSGAEMRLRPLQLLGLGWNGVFVMAIATTTWAVALDSGKTAKISNLAYITPFLSLVWTFLFLKEPLSLWSAAGLVVIVLGILVQLRDKKPAARAHEIN